VIAANSTYLNAVNGLNSANASVTSAQQSLAAAQAKLYILQDGPTDADIAAADAAVASAQDAVNAAVTKLASVREGADQFQRSTALAAVDSARVALTAAEARRDETYRGADANAFEQARQAVRTAQLQVVAAELRLRDAQITAPFDGTVGAVNIKPGEFATASIGADGAPPIVLLTPDRMTLTMNVGETDYGTVKVGQGGVAIFDGIPGRPYPFTISEIGLSPIVNQGVVTYEVKADIVILPDSARPAPGMNARGQLTTESRPDVLVVPPRAIRLRGTEQIVDVRRDGGVAEQVITTGATDNENVEVVTGLEEGEVVLVVTLTSAENATPRAESTLPGGIR
jgi:multidrug efflux pump subunit AcrA (membrane-fusion protein)